MRPIDLPMVDPRHAKRRITANEVVRLSHGEGIPGVDMSDPRVQSIRRTRLTNPARTDMAEARRNGYLFVRRPSYEDGVDRNMESLWGWWCAAAGHPYILLVLERDTTIRIRCDVSTAGHVWTFADVPAIVQLISHAEVPNRTQWLFTPDELQLDDLLEMETAITIARGLVDLTTAGRMRPGAERVAGQPTPPGVHVAHPTPMERSDWNGSRRQG